MKKIFTFIVILTVSLNMQAQEKMYIWQNGVKTSFVVAEVDSVTFGEDATPPAIGTENGHEWVDLGLSVKWATCNVGANKPEEYGDYFAWGEVEPKDYYDFSTYKWCKGTYNTQTKYCTDASYGTVDNKTILDAADDAATANWGGAWRIPSRAEITELREQCTCVYTTYNGVNGYKVTSNKNGNYIFLPSAGFRYGSSLESVGDDDYGDVYIWSNSLATDIPFGAYCLRFIWPDMVWYSYNRRYGFSVRPVYP